MWIAKFGKKITKYVLAVVPGDAKVDLQAVKALLKGTYVAFASSDIAERLAGSVAGTILPFSFTPELELIIDPSLLENDEIFFNAARLDRSLVLRTSDYVALAKPRLRTRFLLSLTLLIAALTFATLAVVRHAAEAQVRAAVEHDARNSVLTFQNLRAERQVQLEHNAELLATLPALKEMMALPWAL